MKDLMASFVKQLVAKSKDFQQKIETAKTETKKRFYLKKLKANNKELANALVRLEHLTKKEEN